ncbi:glycosyltransferase family 25 (LPS biosynthesis protein) [Holospora obtusa F1]|uniref:Glycosyltransferase family 25 (LPS biosynthesis protein) n=1 Tax=Holospora obtusa F1 TaxID=1399147 RepID=W6TEB7_HOLOB|nr:glycosyltransferase family 25 protein [Holospora obtusa]ETZ07024.1 glycosyltransferase family 25 (LPS biosynthesis protein) [Holospora obtusa F1]
MSWNDEKSLKGILSGVVLNLSCNSRRYKEFMSYAVELPFKIDRLEAQDGNMLSSPVQEALVDSRVYARHYAGKFPSSGTIGCYLTHRFAWEYMIKQELPWMIVFEDDILFCPKKLSQAVFGILDKYKNHVDICSFALRGNGIPLSVGSVLEHNLCVYGREVYCAGAYLLNLKSAQQLLKYSLPMQFQLDDYYTQTWRWNLVFTGLEPRIAHHHDHGESDIKARGGRQFRKIHYSSKILQILSYGVSCCISAILREFLNLRRFKSALSNYVKFYFNL